MNRILKQLKCLKQIKKRKQKRVKGELRKQRNDLNHQIIGRADKNSYPKDDKKNIFWLD